MNVPFPRPSHVKVGDFASFNVAAVWLDGVKQDHVIEFDQSEGWLIRYVFADGKFVVVDKDIQTEKLSGKITVDWKN